MSQITRVERLLNQLSAPPSVENDAAFSRRLPFSEKLFRLDGRVALVTGGSQGLGLEIARALAYVGASVFLIARTRETVLAAAKGVEVDTGSKAMGFVADVSKEEDCKNAVAACISEFGRLDILVNAAGILPEILPGEKMSAKDFGEEIDIEIKGTFMMCQQAIPYLKMQRAPRIINVESITIYTALPGMIGHVASKGGINGLTRNFAVELGDTRIRVNSIAPGWIYTPMTDIYFEDRFETAEQEIKELVAATPVRRIADVREIAGAAVYLAGDLASFTTGSAVLVGGGMTKL